MATTGRRSPGQRRRRTVPSRDAGEHGNANAGDTGPDEEPARTEPTTRARPAGPSRRSRSGKSGRPRSGGSNSGGRPSRQLVRQRRQVLALSVLTVLTIGYLLYFTELVGVRSVEVVGANEVPADRIRELAAVPAGQPMLRVDTDEVAMRVSSLPTVASVEVSRSWPSTIEIAVTERRPIGFYDTGRKLYLVDRGGFVYKEIGEPVQGLPKLELSKVGPHDAATRSVASVLADLPPQLREQVRFARAETPGSIELALADGRIVRWGDAEQTGRKAKVLAVLLTRAGEVYDVSSPELPTVS
ncbi:cell division septal protein [Saccharomonospora marina XMU15]|uniref:Cell division septal protein n=1 Tax=Saccharomonospora marina XMU15 TaxID=882083 RepID=H5WZX2_9PSEU|nr:FtsQ-type POTRA domain-containing protein [Saccharomonospora marina]EHR51909.1 cell division septal protein [Saccharomonospora marina XMU15]